MAESNGDVRTQEGEQLHSHLQAMDFGLQFEVNSLSIRFCGVINLVCCAQNTRSPNPTLPVTLKMGPTSLRTVSSRIKRRKPSR